MFYVNNKVLIFQFFDATGNMAADLQHLPLGGRRGRGNIMS
jgi:hypothetical protein